MKPLILATALAALCFAPVTAQRGAVAAQGQQPPALREVSVVAIPGVVEANAMWHLAWSGRDNADGLVGLPDGSLLFAQEQPNRVSRLDADDRVSAFAEDTHGAGALALDAKRRLLAVQRTCTDPGRSGGPCTEPTAVAILAPPKERRTLADNVSGMPLGRVNDLVVSRRGGVYFTSGGAFYLPSGGKVVAFGGNLRTNGIMLSPDEKTLYVTNGATVAAFDVAADGAPRNQRQFATLQAGGAGDGLAIDGAGRLYVTSQPGVQVFDAAGTYLGLIPTPRAVISAAFAGRGRRTLYVVGSGALGPDGSEVTTPAGVRNNAKSIFKLQMQAQGYAGRAK